MLTKQYMSMHLVFVFKWVKTAQYIPSFCLEYYDSVLEQGDTADNDYDYWFHYHYIQVQVFFCAFSLPSWMTLFD